MKILRAILSDCETTMEAIELAVRWKEPITIRNQLEDSKVRLAYVTTPSTPCARVGVVIAHTRAAGLRSYRAGARVLNGAEVGEGGCRRRAHRLPGDGLMDRS